MKKSSSQSVSQKTTVTVAEALNQLKHLFLSAGLESPAMDARLLVGYATGLSLTELVTQAHVLIDEKTEQLIQEMGRRRLKHEPVARILGTQDFWKLSFILNRETLVPRPDTETLVEYVLDLFPDKEAALQILDLGCGTGCILLSLLSEYPNAKGVGVDISEEALEAARFNAALNHIPLKDEHIRFLHSDWTAEVYECFDVVVSNPPYIPTKDISALEPDVRDYDPHRALNGGSDGLDAYRVIFQQVRRIMKPDARLFLEIGQGQQTAVVCLGEKQGFRVGGIRKDYSGITRVLVFSIE